MTLPRMDSVWALYALQKSMMLTPCGPRAVPTGGAGVAAPAWSWTLTSAAIFFFGGIALSLSSRGHDEGPDGPLPLRRVRSVRSGHPAEDQCHRWGDTDPNLDQTFWIWLKLSSTGVSRPKISTSALTRCDSALSSVMVACSVANGPSTTMTESETSKSATATGFFAAAPDAALGVPAAAASASARATTAGASMLSTSDIDSGTGWWLWPTKPVTDGVCRTADHDSSVRSMRTRT